MIAHWTIEAGEAAAFLRSDWLAAYLDVGAKLALFFQRKVDASKATAEIRRRIYRQ